MKKQTLLALAVLSLSACHTMKEASLPDYSIKDYHISSNIKIEGADNETYFSMRYPEFKDSTINRFVMTHIVLDSGKTSVDQMGQSFIAEFNQYAKESEHKNPWFEERKDSITMQTPSYIGFQSDWSTYTGGAHGMYSTVFYNYDVENDEEIKLETLIEPSRYADLVKLGEEIFRKDEGLTPDQSLEDNYFFEEGKFYLTDNFTLNKEGILFLYNIYEIKPYVSGQTQLLIPYRSVQTLLSEKGKQLMEEIQAL